MNKWLASLLLLGASAPAAEKAAYDSNGRIMALLSDGEDLEVSSGLAAVLPGGKRVPLLGARSRSPIRRERSKLAWSGSFQLPDESAGQFQLAADEQGTGVKYSVSLTAESALHVVSIEWARDLRPIAFSGREPTPG